MSVELFFGLIIIVMIVAIIFFNRTTKGLDVNQDGKVDVDDAKAAVKNTVDGVKKEVAKRTSNRGHNGGVGRSSIKKSVVKAKTGKITRTTRKS